MIHALEHWSRYGIHAPECKLRWGMVTNANHLPNFTPISPLFDDGEMDVAPHTHGQFCRIWYQTNDHKDDVNDNARTTLTSFWPNKAPSLTRPAWTNQKPGPTRAAPSPAQARPDPSPAWAWPRTTTTNTNSDDGKDNDNFSFWHNNQPVVGCIPAREGCVISTTATTATTLPTSKL